MGGLIILPDDWVQPSGCWFTAGFSEYNENNFPYGTGDWTHNNYSFARWEQMETAGAVFLPAAGLHIGVNDSIWEYWGCYWLSTHWKEGVFCMSF